MKVTKYLSSNLKKKRNPFSLSRDVTRSTQRDEKISNLKKKIEKSKKMRNLTF